jgi:hypothetical protein
MHLLKLDFTWDRLPVGEDTRMIGGIDDFFKMRFHAELIKLRLVRQIFENEFDCLPSIEPRDIEVIPCSK